MMRAIAVMLMAAGIGVIGFSAVAVAQAGSDDPGVAVVGMICQNQTLVATLLTFFMAHFGFSLASAGLKKMGLTGQNQSALLNATVAAVRAIAIDVKPPAAVIVQQAAAIQAKNAG